MVVTPSTSDPTLRDTIGRLAPGARADAILLEAASHADFVYRPGVPLVGSTFIGGQQQ